MEKEGASGRKRALLVLFRLGGRRVDAGAADHVCVLGGGVGGGGGQKMLSSRTHSKVLTSFPGSLCIQGLDGAAMMS